MGKHLSMTEATQDSENYQKDKELANTYEIISPTVNACYYGKKLYKRKKTMQ